MEERILKFTHKSRSRIAPICPCGQSNKNNPHFAPYDDCEGQYGYCHRCDKLYKPDSTAAVHYICTPPIKAVQQFIPEQGWNWIFPDILIDPLPENPRKIEGQYTITFFFRDLAGKLTASKRMVYNFPAFKRVHDKHPFFPYMRDSGYYRSLFYEYDLTKYPKAKVILVESEKTAALLRFKFQAYLDEFIYLATGGSNGLTDDKISVFRGRTVLIVYDCDNGQKQEDSTIKGPKGREAAQAAYLKLTPVASPIVIDIDPSRDDGFDLGDCYKEIDIEYIRALEKLDATQTKIPQALVDALRNFNKQGEYLTAEKLEEIGTQFNIDGDKILSIYYVIREQYSAETGLNKAPLIPRIEHWLSEHYHFQRNSITQQIFYKKRGEASWREGKISNLWREIHHDIRSIGKGKRGDLTIAKSDIETILDSDFVAEHNPFRDYFESLPPWDGKDHITALGNHILTDDQDFWLQQFKKCLVRMIACTIDNVVNRIVMTLVQETQESGKSTWIRFLCPPALREYYKETPMTHDKDTEIALTENFIWNLEELADLNKKQVADMKAVVSRESVKQRRSYGRNEKAMRRIVNFWGSTNKTEFLADTQNTRWLCFTVISVNQDYNNTATGVKTVDIDKVWAQAWHLYKTNFKYNLDHTERERRDRANQNYESMPEEKQLILRFFRPGTATNPLAKFLANYDIKEHLNQNTSAKTRINEMNIGRSMKQLGFRPEVRKIQGKTSRGYWVIVSSQPIEYDKDTMLNPQLFPVNGLHDDAEVELPF
jgi:predicted P-loop ATPase